MIYNVVQPPRNNSAQMAGEERYDLWRKQGFICRPFSSEIKDGTRFLDDYLEQAQKLEADDDWMEDDVLLGKDQGGDDAAAPPMPVAGAPGHAAAVAARRKRLKKAAARFLDHAGATPSIKNSLKAADAAVEYNVRAMYVHFRANLCEATLRGDTLDIKARMTMATILGAVGFKVDSPMAFQMFLETENKLITPAADRLTELQLCEYMLRALSKTGVGFLAGEALNELNAMPAQYRFHNGHNGAAR